MLMLPLTLAACTGAAPPEQPREAEWMPCAGHGLYEGGTSYARCIRHIAALLDAPTPSD